MSVYVDALQRLGYVGRLGPLWCHLIADTEDELHAFAQRIGMKRSWFQGPPKHDAHYDLVPSRRKLAVIGGAVELGRRDFVYKLREIRASAGGVSPTPSVDDVRIGLGL